MDIILQFQKKSAASIYKQHFFCKRKRKIDAIKNDKNDKMRMIKNDKSTIGTEA